jgi:predicted nucleic acid-binding protein
VSGVVADTSVWIDFLAGRDVPQLETALAEASLAVPPIVVSEIVSGARRPRDRRVLTDLLREIPIHDTPLEHWVRVGDLRRTLRAKGLTVSTPDAHVAQCALDRRALLLTKDRVFARIAALTELRISAA